MAITRHGVSRELEDIIDKNSLIDGTQSDPNYVTSKNASN
jgi:hypothetical protein